jgi:chemosensory pili system protein ChpA (sensor histidine kinase/response regulator)
VGLLPVLRGDDPRGGCGQILQVIDQLHELARCVGTAQLWRITGAFLDVLIAQETVSAAVRPILGQIDHQIRRLIEEGEGELAERPNLQLAKNLLYYVATAASPTARVVEVQTDYGLAEALPSEAEVETAQNSLATPNEEMMNTVVQAIREDIATVKDGLDLYVRGTKSDPDSLQRQAEQLGTVGDTLAMIGAGALRVIVKDQAEALARLVADPDAAGDGSIMEIASELLVVESRLQQGLLQSAATHAPAAMDDRPAEYVAVTDATLHEIMVEMANSHTDNVTSHFPSPGTRVSNACAVSVAPT